MAKVKERAIADAPVWREQSEAVTRALQPLDLVACGIEGRWGYGRLPRLVSPEMAQRFGSAQDKLNAAIKTNDGEEVARRAAVMIRGWQALEQAAEAGGYAPLPTGTWSVQHEGRAFTVVLDRNDADAVARKSGSPATVLCVHELLAAWSILRGRETIEAIKQKFPGALAQRLNEGKGDEIPF